MFLRESKEDPTQQLRKNPPGNAGDTGKAGSIPVQEDSPGGGSGNPLQYCLENPMDRGAWRATVHRVKKSGTQLSTHGNKWRGILCSLIAWMTQSLSW